MKENKILNINFIIRTILFLFILLSLSRTTVFADNTLGHKVYYLRSYIDTERNSYRVRSTFDTNDWGKGMESKTGVDWGVIFNQEKNGAYGFIDKASSLSMGMNGEAESDDSYRNGKTVDGTNGLMFSYPGYKRTGGFLGAKDSANQADKARAGNTATVMTTSINNLIEAVADGDTIIGDNTTIDNISELVAVSAKLAPTRTSGSWRIADVSEFLHIAYAAPSIDELKTKGDAETLTEDSMNYESLLSHLPNCDKDGNLYCYTFKTDANNSVKNPRKYTKGMVYAVPKGYIWYDGEPVTAEKEKEYSEILEEKGISNWLLSKTKITKGKDTVYMSVFHCMMYANDAYAWDGLDDKVEDEVDFIQETINDIFSSTVQVVSSLLGLSSVHSLVYNDGIRGGESYEDGMMNANWWKIVTQFHLVFQVIAWMLIGLAVAKILIELNFSTVNPAKRMSVMETLQKLFTVGFLLALALPIVKLIASLNNSFVGIFEPLSQDDAAAFTVGANLGQIFVYLGYFGILIIINCIYIMRGIMIAILAASAPLFIVSMAFTSKGGGLFTTWLKEIVANICMQSVHAFSFAFLFQVMDNSTTLEELCIMMSLLPITDTFRGFIFQSAGSFASSQGQQVGQAVHSMSQNIRQGVGSGIAEGAAAGEASNQLNQRATALSQGSATAGGAASLNSNPAETASGGGAEASTPANIPAGTQVQPAGAGGGSAGVSGGSSGTQTSANPGTDGIAFNKAGRNVSKLGTQTGTNRGANGMMSNARDQYAQLAASHVNADGTLDKSGREYLQKANHMESKRNLTNLTSSISNMMVASNVGDRGGVARNAEQIGDSLGNYAENEAMYMHEGGTEAFKGEGGSRQLGRGVSIDTTNFETNIDGQTTQNVNFDRTKQNIQTDNSSINSNETKDKDKV